MKSLLLFVFPLLMCFGHPSANSAKQITNVNSLLPILQARKTAIDKYIKSHQKAIIALAKVPDKSSLIVIKNEKWPDDVEYSYNVVRDSAGKIILIAQIPFSESGDWDIEIRHYFDDNGHTFAFSKMESTFYSSIQGGIVRNEKLKYYNTQFNIVSSTNKFFDVKNKPIKINKSEVYLHDDIATTYKTVAQCLASYNIKLK